MTSDCTSMTDLHHNAYNQQLPRSVPKFKLWRYAGIMLTYRCPARCALCYYNCHPGGRGRMSPGAILDCWRSLRELAGKGAKVHLTGGEPFLYYEDLAEAVRGAAAEGLSGLDSIETNACWATDEAEIEERVGFLFRHGLERLKISWDPFHAEFIDRANVVRLVEVAGRIMGRERVLIRWEKYLHEAVSFARRGHGQVADRQHGLRQDGIRFTGRAAWALAAQAADKPLEELLRLNCAGSFLNARGVHVDPFGNVFSGLCSGITLGNIHETELDRLWRGFDPTALPVIGKLFHSGPGGLLDEAVRSGYKPRKTYAGKCHLCTELRQFFVDNHMYSMVLCPEDCYESSGRSE